METRASYVVVGLFTLLVLIGGVVAVIWMAGIRLDDEIAQYDIYFRGNVTGLKEGNQVRYRGVPFGVVTAMRVDPDNVEQVKVTIEVPSKPPIKADAIASLEYQGITGVAYVQIGGGTQPAEVLKRKPGEKFPVIASKASQLDVVLEKAPELVTRFIALVDRANALLNPANQEKFALILDNVEGFTGALSDSRTDIRSLLQNSAQAMGQVQEAATEAKAALAKLHSSSDRVADDAEAAMRDARELVGELRKKVERLTGETTSTLGTVRDSIAAVTLGVTDVTAEARVTLAEVKRLASDLRISTLEFTGGMSGALQSMEREMDGVGADTRAAIKTLNRSAGHVGDAAEQLAGFIKENREPVQDFSASGLYELTQLLSETRVLVGALSRISAQIEQNPARFLFGNTQSGVEVK